MAASRTRVPHGPCAVFAGASESVGAAWAEALARRGLHVLAVGRRSLEQTAQRLALKNEVEVTPGRANKLAAFMRRLLPRATATAITGRAVKGFDAP
jgi:uncharacterized protein